ncbi:MAG: twin-arginine translocation signal domain-containing protein, partial [Myxococcota bacterium]|nr:twin-arginine translocation signal domain-containing protein [Myxococcota bacterium]
MSTFKRRPLSRRTFLRGAAAGGAIAMGLPLLEAMLSPKHANAQAGQLPFFGVFYWANGLPWTDKHGGEQATAGHPDHWTPAEDGTYTPTPLLEPLA